MGSIPVIFSDDLSLFRETALGSEILDLVVVWNSGINIELFDYLSKFNLTDLSKRSQGLISSYRKVQLHKGYSQ